MMFVGMFPLLLAIVGWLLWVVCGHEKVKQPTISQTGYVMFCCGLLVFTFAMAHETVSLGKGRHASAQVQP